VSIEARVDAVKRHGFVWSWPGRWSRNVSFQEGGPSEKVAWGSRGLRRAPDAVVFFRKMCDTSTVSNMDGRVARKNEKGAMGGLSALVARIGRLGKGGQAAHGTLPVNPKMVI